MSSWDRNANRNDPALYGSLSDDIAILLFLRSKQVEKLA